MKTKHKEMKNHLVVAIAAALAFGCGVARAQTPAPAVETPPEPPKWKGTVNAGLTLTSGNIDTLLATVGATADKKWDQHELAFGAFGGYGESDDTKSAEFLQGFGQYKYLFTDRAYGGLRIDGTYDGIANLSYRFNISPLAGYFFIKNDRTRLSAEVGPSLVIERYFGENDNDSYLGMRFGQRFEHKLTETTRIWENLDYTPQVDRWTDKYIVNVEVGITTSINKSWSLRVVGQYIYDSEPPTGQSDTLRLIAGTEYKF